MCGDQNGFTFTLSETHNDETLKVERAAALADTCVATQVRERERQSQFWPGSGEQGKSDVKHPGLAEDCEIAVCQGKTRGQLWAPIDGRVGRYSWKDAAQGRLSRGEDSQARPPTQSVWPF